jgi:hypothetical protein
MASIRARADNKQLFFDFRFQGCQGLIGGKPSKIGLILANLPK